MTSEDYLFISTKMIPRDLTVVSANRIALDQRDLAAQADLMLCWCHVYRSSIFISELLVDEQNKTSQYVWQCSSI